MQELAVQMLNGKTVLMVTHDPLEAVRMADHVMVMGNQPATIVDTLDLASLKPRNLDDPVVIEAQQRVMQALNLTTLGQHSERADRSS